MYIYQRDLSVESWSLFMFSFVFIYNRRGDGDAPRMHIILKGPVCKTLAKAIHKVRQR